MCKDILIKLSLSCAQRQNVEKPRFIFVMKDFFQKKFLFPKRFMKTR